MVSFLLLKLSRLLLLFFVMFFIELIHFLRIVLINGVDLLIEISLLLCNSLISLVSLCQQLPIMLISLWLNLLVEFFIDSIGIISMTSINSIYFLQVLLFLLGIECLESLDLRLEFLVLIDQLVLVISVLRGISLDLDTCLLDMYLQFTSLGLWILEHILMIHYVLLQVIHNLIHI